MRLLVVWLINTVALIAVAYLLPGVSVASFVSALVAALLAQRGGKERGESRGLERHAEETSLPLLAAQIEQALELCRALEPFGGDADADGMRQRGDGAHDRLVGEVRLDGAQEQPIDLQLVDRQLAQIGEARVAGAEVVDGEAHAELADLGERRGIFLEVLHQHPLGHLELEALAVEIVRGEAALHLVDEEVALRELRG